MTGQISTDHGEVVSNAEYHHGKGWCELLGSTTFKPFYSSPAEFRWPMTGQGSVEAMALGSVTHSAILEPETLDAVLVLPDAGFNAEGKRAWAHWITDNGGDPTGLRLKEEYFLAAHQLAESKGLQAATNGQLDSARAMAISVWETDDAREALENGDCELSFRAHGRKARPDCIADQLLIDVKTTSKFDRFSTEAHDRRYPESLAWYESVLEYCHRPITAWCWIAVESTPYRMAADNVPRHRVKAWIATDECMADSRYRMRRALVKYRECKSTDKWPAWYAESGMIGEREPWRE